MRRGNEILPIASRSITISSLETQNTMVIKQTMGFKDLGTESVAVVVGEEGGSLKPKTRKVRKTPVCRNLRQAAPADTRPFARATR